MPGPLTPRHKGTVCGDDETPLKTYRDSARSVLLTEVHDQLPGLAVHPPGAHDLAAPDWRGGHAWGARRRSRIVDGLQLGVAAAREGPVLSLIHI